MEWRGDRGRLLGYSLDAAGLEAIGLYRKPQPAPEPEQSAPVPLIKVAETPPELPLVNGDVLVERAEAFFLLADYGDRVKKNRETKKELLQKITELDTEYEAILESIQTDPTLLSALKGQITSQSQDD